MRHTPARRPLGRTALFAAVVSTFLPALAAHAASVTWTPTAGGTFSTASNWSTGAAPTSADTAVFSNSDSAGQTVTLSAATQLRGLTVANDHLTLDLAGHNLAVNVTAADGLLVGTPAGAGSLTVTSSNAPATLSTNSFATVGQASAGALTATGANATVSVTRSLALGVGGAASLTISDGAHLSSGFGTIGSGATASATVTGPGSSWTIAKANLAVGHTSQGTLSIQNGAVVSNDTSFVGNAAGSTGTASVSGAGSQWNHALDLVVGSSGSGTLTISDHAAVTDRDAVLGLNSSATSTATLTGPGSSWTTNRYLVVGVFGNASLTVADGAAATAGTYIDIADTSRSTSSVTVDNASLSTPGDLYVGLKGNGTLTARNAAQVSASYLAIAPIAGSTGSASVTGTGSSLAVAGPAYIGGYEAGAGGAASLSVGPGASFSAAGPVTIFAGSSLALSGGSLSAASIANAGTLSSSTANTISSPVANHGTVAGPTGSFYLTFTGPVTGEGSYTGNVQFSNSFSPGNSPASVTLDNATLAPTNTLTMELAGATTPGTEYDHLTATGTLTLGGAFQVLLLDSFVPAAGNSFDLFDGTLTGTFATLDLPALPSNLLWDTSALYTTGILSVTAAAAPVPLPASATAGLALCSLLAAPQLARRLRGPHSA